MKNFEKFLIEKYESSNPSFNPTSWIEMGIIIEYAEEWNKQVNAGLVEALEDCMSYVDIDNLTMQTKEQEWKQALKEAKGE